MKILKIDPESGDIIDYEHFTPGMFTFDEPPETDEEVIEHSETKPIFIEGDSAKKLMCIENDTDLRAYLKLCRLLNVDMSSKSTFQSYKNPIVDVYDKWMKTWRIESIEGAYEWREGVDMFTSLRRDKDVGVYLDKLEDVEFALVEDSI